MGLADVALSEVIAGKITHESVPGLVTDNSFMPMLAFPGGPVVKKAA